MSLPNSDGLDPVTNECHPFRVSRPQARSRDHAGLFQLAGNREAGIRGNLVDRRWIDGVTGFPATSYTVAASTPN